MYYLVVQGLNSRTRLSDIPVDTIPFVHSKSQLKKLIKARKVRVNHDIATTATWVENGSLLEFQEEIWSSDRAYEMQLDVLYEDASILIINKPGGIIVSGNKHRTLDNAILHHCKDKQLTFRPRCVHRIDSQTSGLVLAAKSYEAMLNLHFQVSKHLMEKDYLAIVNGEVPLKMIVSLPVNGKRATSEISRIKVIDSQKYGQLNLVIIRIYEGRTHQIRKHSAWTGHPVVGDKLYNNTITNRVKGMYLHAWKIKLRHPVSEEMMIINTPLPRRFQNFGISQDDLPQY